MVQRQALPAPPRAYSDAYGVKPGHDGRSLTSIFPLPGIRPALRAILEATEGIDNAARGKPLDDLGTDWLLRHGIQRGIEMVSAATRKIPSDYTPIGQPRC
jgi:hypothetical protein